jgi:hypothetical protein
MTTHVRSQSERKAEWLAHCHLDKSASDQWLRRKIISLFELEKPDEAESLLLTLADVWLTMFDLPVAECPKHKARMFEIAQRVFPVE